MAGSEIPSGVYDAMFGTRDGARYGRIDPNDHAAQPTIHFDADSPNDDTKIIVTQPDDRFALTFAKARKLVCFLGTPDQAVGEALPRCFETREEGSRGPSESPLFVRYPNGMLCASVEYIDRGRHFFSCNLTLVPR